MMPKPRKSKIGSALIDPGKPWQNGTNESFNGQFRNEGLSLEWFRSRRQARVVIETWRRHYNEVRWSCNCCRRVTQRRRRRRRMAHSMSMRARLCAST